VSETEPPPPGLEPAWEPAWDPDTGPQPSQSGPRSHRAPPQLSRLLAPLTAVVVVIVVVGLLIWINGRPTGGSSAAISFTATTPKTPQVVAPPVTHSSSPTTPASPKPKPKPTSPAKSSQTPHRHHRHHTAPLTAMAPVQVLNNSRIHGLAHSVAPEVAAKGWHIATIGNLQGLISESTVFYAPGERAAALHLAHEFSSIRRVEPNSFAHLSAAGITLVLTADWVT
jgi:hypothetical protein